MIQREPTCWVEDGHATLYLNCIENTNTTHMLLRDSSWCCKESRCYEKCCRGMGCAVVQQACSEVHTSLSIKVNCSSVWLCCIGSLLPESCS